jgi:hypothetical protein
MRQNIGIFHPSATLSRIPCITISSVAGNSKEIIDARIQDSTQHDSIACGSGVGASSSRTNFD